MTIGNMAGALVSSAIMEVESPWIPWFIGVLCLFIGVSISLWFPNTKIRHGAKSTSALATTPDSSLNPAEDPQNERPRSRRQSSISIKTRNLWTTAENTVRTIFSNSRFPLLIAFDFLSFMSRDAKGLMLLLFASKRYGWSFGKVRIEQCPRKL